MILLLIYSCHYLHLTSEKKYVGFQMDLFHLLRNMKKNSHSMLSLTLRPRSKNLLLVQEHGVAIVEEYEKKSLFPMLLKCHQILFLMVELEL